MKRDTILTDISMISQLGFMMVSSILLGFAIGYFCDAKFQTSPLFTLVFLVVGIVAGFWSVYKMIIKRIELK